MNRRRALQGLLQFVAASPLLRADRKYSQIGDPLLRPVNIFDFAKLAKAKLDPLAWDYLDEGSEDEQALHDNRAAFNKVLIRPHFLQNNVSKIDLSTTLFSKPLPHPIFLCPTGGKNCIFPNGEQETALGAAGANTMMITTGGIDQILASGKGPKVWWQFTTAANLKTKQQSADFTRKLKDSGCSGISVTVDIYLVSHRERSMHNGLVRGWCQASGVPRKANGDLAYKPDDVLWTSGDYPPARPFSTPTWDTLKQLRDNCDLPVIVKGVLTSEDTELAVKNGLSGVIVSNHGARQLDGVGGTMEALPECIKAADGKIPVLIDGGFRRGTDIFKALAMGASAIGIGRPYLYGLGTFGSRGVTRVIELLRAELATDMGMAGVGNLKQINPSYVRARTEPG